MQKMSRIRNKKPLVLEVATRGVLCKRCSQKFHKIQRRTSAPESSFQLQLKKRLWHRCFPLNFVKFLRTHFLQNTLDDYFFCFIFFTVLLTYFKFSYDAKALSKVAFTLIYILMAYILLLVNKVIYKWHYLYIKI